MSVQNRQTGHQSLFLELWNLYHAPRGALRKVPLQLLKLKMKNMSKSERFVLRLSKDDRSNLKIITSQYSKLSGKKQSGAKTVLALVKNALQNPLILKS